ncbi:glycosyltransferase, partial [bacterium]|nr:glycosyltransferase [bacterium]
MVGKGGRIGILHIITNLPVGGAQDNTLITVERLDRSKFDVTLMCSDEGQWVDRARKIKDLKLEFIDKLTRRIRIFNDIIAFLKIYRILRQGDYKIVHTHSSKPGVLGRFAAKFAGVPVIIHTIHGFPFHDFMNPVLNHLLIRLERILSRLSDRLVTVSTLNLEKANKLRLADPYKLVNIYSGIDFKRFDIEIDREAKRR